jgi:hypothetical protein
VLGLDCTGRCRDCGSCRLRIAAVDRFQPLARTLATCALRSSFHPPASRIASTSSSRSLAWPCLSPIAWPRLPFGAFIIALPRACTLGNRWLPLTRVRIAPGSSGNFLTPSPPAEKAAARQDQARCPDLGAGDSGQAADASDNCGFAFEWRAVAAAAAQPNGGIYNQRRGSLMNTFARPRRAATPQRAKGAGLAGIRSIPNMQSVHRRTPQARPILRRQRPAAGTRISQLLPAA